MLFRSFITSELEVLEIVIVPVVVSAVFEFWMSELAVFVMVLVLDDAAVSVVLLSSTSEV